MTQCSTIAEHLSPCTDNSSALWHCHNRRLRVFKLTSLEEATSSHRVCVLIMNAFVLTIGLVKSGSRPWSKKKWCYGGDEINLWGVEMLLQKGSLWEHKSETLTWTWLYKLISPDLRGGEQRFWPTKKKNDEEGITCCARQEEAQRPHAAAPRWLCGGSCPPLAG